MHIPFYKRLLSYFLPVKIRSSSGKVSPVLELFLYCNRWQLASSSVLYSDGDRYRPLFYAFRTLKKNIRDTDKILVLGGGLGSAAYILDSMGIGAHITLVDNDGTVVQWAHELFPASIADHIDYICADAQTFVLDSRQQYDIVVIDIFIDREIPPFVTSNDFLRQCYDIMRPDKGIVIFNYMMNDTQKWLQVKQDFSHVFTIRNVIDLGVNKVIIAERDQLLDR